MKEYKKSKIVRKTSVFPASRSKVFEMLSGFKILSEKASPYIKFRPVGNKKDFVWKEGETFDFKAKLFGFIPFGTHSINVIEFKEDGRIYTNEKNTYVPVWNHEIILKDLSDSKTEYTDNVEIYAGWKTFFVYTWAKSFYSHRQKKWIKILKSEQGE